MGGGLAEASVGKVDLGQITLGQDIIWEKDPYKGYKPRVMVLMIETTRENQIVNLGHKLKPWKDVTHSIVNWGDDSEEYSFTGKEGTGTASGLCHTYAKAGEYNITIKGVIQWGGYSSLTDELIEKTLKKIEIPEGKTSPLYYIDTYAFYNSAKLESIPGNLFENCSTVTNFLECFGMCSSLQSVPNGLFDHCTRARSFNRCFQSCHNLIKIPEGLFDNCINVTTFGQDGNFGCFASTGLIKIPDHLFDNCINVSAFGGCFANAKITEIPEDLFKYNINAKNFYYTFSQCPITYIPEKLFANNNKVTAFNKTFYLCKSVEGNLPALWESHPDASHTNCFTNCTLAENYDEAIAQGWA